MSRSDVDTVLAGLERWAGGDHAGALEPLAPAVELRHNIGLGTPLEGVYRGHDEVRRLWAEIGESFEIHGVDVERAFEHEGRVVVLGMLRMHGAGSGAAADAPFGVVSTVEGGLVTRQDLWTGDRSHALEAAGLAENG
jgi:hypothetical protein